MVIAKKINWQKLLIFSFLVLFPLGQLLRTEVLINDFHLVIQPIDFVVGLSAVFFLTKVPFWFAYSLIFSFLLSWSIFKPIETVEGAFYLLRLLVYLAYPYFILQALRQNRISKKLLFDLLIIVCVAVAILGWLQYLIYPDARVLFYLGWDDHLYRLLGTFLDPGFTALILVFGFILTFNRFCLNRRWYYLLISALMVVSLLLTYSRAGYLSLAAGLSFLLLRLKKTKLLLLGGALLVILIFLLPRPSSSGVQLERLYSVFLRLGNYQETVSIWKRWPLFGVGYNNLCAARVKYLGAEAAFSHSCSGSDSSLLLLLTTTGIIGLTIFLTLVYRSTKLVESNLYGLSYLAGLVALFTHSLFVNSLFYPWVMGLIGILFALACRSTSKSEG